MKTENVWTLGMIFTIVIIVSLSTLASATDLYVNGTNGNDLWDGLSETWDGTHGPKKKIQAGIDVAASGDTITISDGIYKGWRNIDLDFLGKDIILRSQNGPKHTIIDCKGTQSYLHRGFNFHSGETVNSLLDGFTIINGYAVDGGALSCSNSSPTIMNCIMENNFATNKGGAVFTYKSNSVFENCVIRKNTADKGQGGGIAAYGPSNGGPTIRSCKILDNKAIEGGGYAGLETTSKFMSCIISGNIAKNGGGIIFSYDNAEILSCTIARNISLHSGGIHCWYSSPIITTSIIWGNEPNQIYVDNGSNPSLFSCDIQGGWKGTGSGNLNEDPRLTPDFHLLPGSPCEDRVTTGPNYDIDSENRPFAWWDFKFDIGADELGDSDQDSMPDYWEIKYLNDALAMNPNCDEDGDDLPNIAEFFYGTNPIEPDTDGDDIWDGTEVVIGEDPLHPENIERTYYVNSTKGDDLYDGLSKEWDGKHGPKRTIQAGIDSTKKDKYHIVEVADGFYLGNRNNNLRCSGKMITIRSENGPETCIIDCGKSERGFYLNWNETEGTIIDGFTVQNGYGSDSGILSSGNSNGGAIYICDSSPSILNCILKENNAKTDGGGISLLRSDSTIKNMVIIANKAGRDGGGIDAEDCRILLQNCLIAENQAGQSGGGVSIYKGSSTLSNCTISTNTSNNGGALEANYTTSLIANSILWNNSPNEIRINKEPQPIIIYSDVQGGWTGFGYGNFNANPLFITGPLHNYYLSHVETGQEQTSPCVDAGSDFPVNLGVNTLTTRIDSVEDTLFVDLGYHSPPTLKIYSMSLVESGLKIMWNAKPCMTYWVKWSDDMDIWHETYVGALNSWIDNTVPMDGQRFYRVIEEN